MELNISSRVARWGCKLPAALLVGWMAMASAQAAEAGRIVLVAGEAQRAGKALAVGDAVNEGDELSTGKQGFLYVRTVDDGLLILRPQSRARVVDYHIDAANPSNTRVKLELLSGVARAVSGSGVKAARQNFRFNTPVAAIGVRGTDFTVYTDDQTSRVTVLSGAIVVSGFNASCMPDGSGPCEHAASRELAATQLGQLLQVQRGQSTPQLMQGGLLKPDTISPPRPDEPVASKGNGTVITAGTGELVLDPKKADGLLNLNVRPSPPVTVGPSSPTVTEDLSSKVVWGRWQTAAFRPVNIDTDALTAEGAKFIARNSYYTIYRTRGTEQALPEQGSWGFALQHGEGVVFNEATGSANSAALENGKLTVDFAKAAFATSFDMMTEGQRYAMQAEGKVTRDGVMMGNGQFSAPSNMNVEGVVSGNKGGSASYIFSGRVDERRVVNGVANWTRQ